MVKLMYLFQSLLYEGAQHAWGQGEENDGQSHSTSTTERSGHVMYQDDHSWK